jgi:hypothetical protein
MAQLLNAQWLNVCGIEGMEEMLDGNDNGYWDCAGGEI